MDVKLALVAAVCLAMTFAGCAGPSPEPTTPSNSSSTAGPAGDIATPQPESVPASNSSLHSVVLDAVWHEGPTGGGAVCGPTQPGVCEMYEAANDTLTGDVAGYAVGIVRGHADPTGQHQAPFSKDLVFTGEVKGCGSGSIHWYVTGFFAADGGGVGVHANETIHFLPGTGTGGLASLVNGTLDYDGYVGAAEVEAGGTFAMHGRVWC